MNKDEKLQPILGLSQHQAETWCKENGYSFRIARINNYPLILTRDYKLTRVNVNITDDKISFAYFG